MRTNEENIEGNSGAIKIAIDMKKETGPRQV
jgi:hypothetical protein